MILTFSHPQCDLIFRVGEGRAYWSLGNAYTALNRHDIALGYAEKHLIVSKEVSTSLLAIFVRKRNFFDHSYIQAIYTQLVLRRTY